MNEINDYFQNDLFQLETIFLLIDITNPLKPPEFFSIWMQKEKMAVLNFKI
jgi:hypothetical protein